MDKLRRSSTLILEFLAPLQRPEVAINSEGRAKHTPSVDSLPNDILRSKSLGSGLEEGRRGCGHSVHQEPDNNSADRSPNSKSGVQEPKRKEETSDTRSNTINKELDGRISSFQDFLIVTLKCFIRAFGASVLSAAVASAFYPWLKYIGREAFLGLAILNTVWPVAEMNVVYILLEERSRIHHVAFLRSITFISLLILFYLVQDFLLWNILFIAEGIQFTTITIEQHYLTPNSTLRPIPKIGFCIWRAIVYRCQLVVMALIIIGSFYVNLNGFGVSNAVHVVITGMAFPMFKSLFTIQHAAYASKLFGKKTVPPTQMEVAVESLLCFPSKFSVILSFPFGQSFLTTVLLTFLSRMVVRFMVVGAIRYSEKPGNDGRFVRFLNPLAFRLKYTVAFVEAGEFAAAIFTTVCSLILARGDIEMDLIYKILIVLLAESACSFLTVAEQYQNGWLVDIPVWIGPLPGLFMLRAFGIYLVTRYAILSFA